MPPTAAVPAVTSLPSPRRVKLMPLAWQQYVANSTQAVTYCLFAVGGSTLLYFPLARRRRCRFAVTPDGATAAAPEAEKALA